MHTQNLAGVLRSLPVEVRFAGFKSTTLALAQAGWDLSMQQTLDFRWGEPSLQLAMRFVDRAGAGMYAISRPMELEYGFLREAQHADEHRLIGMMAQMGFEIMHMGPQIKFCVQPVYSRGVSFASSFEPIDARPQYVEEDIRDFKFFKVAKPTVKDLIVDPRDVPELLELVLKAQKPMLDKVRRREKSRSNEEWMRNGFEAMPRHEVQAQIITLVS